MRERDIESWAVREATKAGWWCRKFKAPGRRSAPDRVFARYGRVFFVEFKATGETPTELQADEHAKMRAAGLTVYWTDSREGFAYILAEESRFEYDNPGGTGYGVTGPHAKLEIDLD